MNCIWMKLKGKNNRAKINYVGKCLLIEHSWRGKNEKMLVIGDLHLGYEGALRRGGLQIPLDLYKEIKKDFDEIADFVFKKYRIKKLNKIIILGDVNHEFGSILKEEWSEIEKFIIYLKERC